MSELLQSAPHPDADQLTAFAEHALPAHEREQTLAHLAICAVCRQLVFMAQETEPAEAAQPVAVKKPWFAGWNLLWPAAAALAGIVVLSVHLRHAATSGSAEQKVAIVTEPPPIPAAPPVAPSMRSEAIAPAPKPMPRVVLKSPDVVAPTAAAPVTAIHGGLPQQGMPIQEQNQASLGFVRSRDKTPSVPLHGPMINQQQQVIVAAAPPVAGQKYAQAPVSLGQGSPPPPAPRPSVVMGGMGVASVPTPPPVAPPVAVTLADTVRAAAAAAPSPVARKAAPQAAAQVASQTVEVDALSGMTSTNGMSLDATSAAIEVMAELPSGRATVSKVSNGSRTVALDAAGALYVSKDDGRHWTAVKPQWPGRAVQISVSAPFAPAANGRNVYALAGRSERGLTIQHNASPDGTHAQIAGSVTDPTGAVISGAAIRVKNGAGMDVFSVRADANGRFTTGALDPGKYAVQISAPGFATFVQTLELQARDRASLGAALQVAAESQTVTVSAAQSEVAKPKLEPFTLTTDAGVTWTSKDGEKWKRP